VFVSQAGGQDLSSEWTALNDKCAVLNRARQFEEATAVAQEALQLAEKHFAPNDAKLATSLRVLAALYSGECALGQAKPLHLRWMAIQEMALGSDPLTIATGLSALASGLKSEPPPNFEPGLDALKELLFNRVLSIRETALGPEHADVAASLFDLSLNSIDQCDYCGAEALLRRSLKIREKVLGLDHKDVASNLNCLSKLLYRKRLDFEAKAHFARCLSILEKNFGPDPLDIVAGLTEFAEGIKCYPPLGSEVGNEARAEALYIRILKLHEEALEPDHPDLVTGINRLAGLYLEQSEYSKAESLYRRAIEIHEKAFGPDHLDVASSLSDLAQVYGRQCSHGKAIELLKRVLAIRKAMLDPKHPDLASTRAQLTSLQLREADRKEEEESSKARAK
jgi:tetratricopeptide (TPR) repeat protein